MRALFVFMLAGSLIFAQSDAEKIRIEGRVVSTTGEPVRKATVRLSPNIARASDLNTVQLPNGAAQITDDSGRFVFDDLKAGSYQVRAERAGFLTQFYGSKVANGSGTPLNLKAGDKLTGITIQMIPHSVIAGRVLDPDGDPVAYVQVRAMRYSYQGGQRQLRAEGTGGTADDQGNYRISGLTPGRYYVKVDRPATPTPLVATYFPNSLDLQGAAAVDVGAGAEQGGMTIRARQETFYSIRGRVFGPTGQPIKASVSILPPDGTMPVSPLVRIGPNSSRLLDASALLGTGQVQTAQDGTFVLRDLLPGAYTVVAAEGGGYSGNTSTDGTFAIRMGTDGGPTARVDVSVGNQDANVEIRLTPGVNIGGRFTVEGGNFEEDFPTDVRSPQLRVLALEGPTVNLPSASARADGTFVLKGAPAGTYSVTVPNLPPGYYVKSMRIGGQDLLRSPLDVSAGGGELEVVLAEGTGEVNGSVVDSQGRAMNGASVSLWARGIRGVRVATTDQNGAFKFTNVAPGDYAVAAFEELPDAGLAQYTPFLAAFAGEATNVKLEPSGNVSSNVKVISREKAAAEVAKLP